MIKIYVITGFLGSGKTTFLNHFLKNNSNSKNLVIENEFGKINIDSKLITEKIDEIIELTNGCICCSLDNELIEILANIIKKENKPNNIFIETTGIADTGNIIGILKSEEIKKFFDYKGCICIVDIENIENRLNETFETSKQIAVSDIIVINKINSIIAYYASNVKDLVKKINPFAHIFESFNGSLNFNELENHLNNIHEFNLPTNLKNTPLQSGHKINTVYFETSKRFDFGELTYALHVNFLLYPHQLFRLKGFVNTKKNNQRYLIQSTGNHISLTPVKNEEWILKSELVFIGIELKTETIQRILRPSLVD
jgi:G3E family GTPase